MKLLGQNSLAFAPHATMPHASDLVGEIGRVDDRISSPQGDAEQSIHVTGARLIETMKQIAKRARFERLVKSHIDPASKLALRLTGNWDAAEELVQETMLRAVRNWNSFREQSQFKTWLYRILINAFRDGIRKRNKVEYDTSQTNEQPSREQTVESQAEAKELNEIISRLTSQLPPRQREVLILSTYESLTNQEIANTLGINVANVHANLCTARKRLKQQLEKYLNP